MSSQTEQKPDDGIAELKKKLMELEQNWTWLKKAAGILGTAVLLLTGFGFIEIPRRAVDEAIKKLTPIIQQAAVDEAKHRITDEMVQKILLQQKRAQDAADDAEKSSNRVKVIEGQFPSSPLKTLQDLEKRPVAQIGSITYTPKDNPRYNLGDPKFFIYSEGHNGDINYEHREYYQRVTFDKPFKNPPKVVVALQLLHGVGGRAKDGSILGPCVSVSVSPEKDTIQAVDNKGFSLSLQVWSEYRLERCGVTYTAIGEE